jgi:hypothetical protein
MDAWVRLVFLPDVDPWMVHVHFLLVGTTYHEIEVSRSNLEMAACFAPQGKWVGDAGAWFQMGTATQGRFVFRLHEACQSHDAPDVSVSRRQVQKFLADSYRKASDEQEKAALSAFVEKALQDEMGMQ